MLEKLIKFKIVTPEGSVYDGNVQQVTLPTKDGEITVLPHHIPLVSILNPGVIEIKDEKGEIGIMSVSSSFVDVLKNKIVVLADTAERAEDLDIEKIEEARRKAEEIKEGVRDADDVQFAQIAAKLAKELARTRAVERWRKIKSIQ